MFRRHSIYAHLISLIYAPGLEITLWAVRRYMVWLSFQSARSSAGVTPRGWHRSTLLSAVPGRYLEIIEAGIATERGQTVPPARKSRPASKSNWPGLSNL